MVGWTDLAADLSDYAQIARVSAMLPVDAPVISSDLSRAVDTADAIAKGRARLAHNAALREIHFGDWENQSFDTVNAHSPDALRAFWEAPGPNAAPNGEGWHDLQGRVNRAVQDVLALGHPDVIIVAHFGAILCQIQRGLGVDTVTAFGQRVDNLSISRLRFDGEWHADLINHLP